MIHSLGELLEVPVGFHQYEDLEVVVHGANQMETAVVIPEVTELQKIDLLRPLVDHKVLDRRVKGEKGLVGAKEIGASK